MTPEISRVSRFFNLSFWKSSWL